MLSAARPITNYCAKPIINVSTWINMDNDFRSEDTFFKKKIQVHEGYN